ncbi:MAG TPA: adenine deaminase [Exilispira sp.]|nr:adenine deaminase [Exilispira sp.]
MKNENICRLQNLIEVASKKRKADLIIKNANLINVFNESIFTSDLAIYDNRIAGIGEYDDGEKVIDAKNLFVSPSFIDSHMHIESTKLIPFELASALLPHGTSCIVCDPHEIANVCGIEGIEFLIKGSQNLPIDIFFLAPSCVPATFLETNKGVLDFKKLIKLKRYKQVLGLAEVMNYPAVIECQNEILFKISSFKDMIIDGHAPSLTKENLNAYISSGIYSDHECTTKEEALEKLSKGMYIMIRQGSVTKDLINLVPIINDKTKNRILLCTDDKDPDDIINLGHINHSIKLLIENGVPIPLAIKLASLNPSIFFGFKQRGAIAPGYFADLVIFEDICSIKYVIKNGKIVFDHGVKNFSNDSSYILSNISKKITNSMNFRKFNLEELKVKNRGKKIRVISIKNDSVITEEKIFAPKVQEGFVIPDTSNDIIKIVVVERHMRSGNIFVGFINGFGLKKGAFASTIAHDSHNIIAIGENDEDLYNSINHLKNINGGIAISYNGKIVADLPLIYAGLMSDMHVHEVALRYNNLKKVAKEVCETILEDPFMTLSFMTLPVIPDIKITDKGIVDVNKFSFVDLFVD